MNQEREYRYREKRRRRTQGWHGAAAETHNYLRAATWTAQTTDKENRQRETTAPHARLTRRRRRNGQLPTSRHMDGPNHW